MKEKKFLSGLLVLLTLITLCAGCGDEKKSEQPPTPPKQEETKKEAEKITVTLDPQVKNDGQNVILEATTNLPDDTKVSLTLTNKYTKLVEMGHDENFDPKKLTPEETKTWESSTYNFSEFVFVKNGKLTTKPFPANQLKQGKAELSARMVFPHLQSDSVKKVIGEKGENLQGDLVKNGSVEIEKKIDL